MKAEVDEFLELGLTKEGFERLGSVGTFDNVLMWIANLLVDHLALAIGNQTVLGEGVVKIVNDCIGK